MKLKLIIQAVALILTVLCSSCQKGEKNYALDSNLLIQAGFVCGWGSGTDSLSITNGAITYKYYIPRQSWIPVVSKTRGISELEWEEIVTSFKASEFEKLTYNTCNVCFDGCDEWISIRNNQGSHKITFTKGMKIDALSRLQLKLAALRDEFNASL